MPLKDLSGKTVYDLDRETFETLFCTHCREYEECPRDLKNMLPCKALLENGLWEIRPRVQLKPVLWGIHVFW